MAFIKLRVKPKLLIIKFETAKRNSGKCSQLKFHIDPSITWRISL